MASKPGLGDLATAGLANIGIGPLNVGNALDAVDFMRKAWSSFGVPSTLTPTADLEEIDRRIHDLKAVEQWLVVNLNMLQGTIQAVEMQRSAIATLKAYGGALGDSAVALPGAQAIANAFAAGMQAIQAGAQSQADDAAHAAAATGHPASQAAGSEGRQGEAMGPDAATRAWAPEGTDEDASARPAAAAAHPGLDPGAWWEMLQQQFSQIASAAMSGVGLASLAPGAAGEAAKTRRRPRTPSSRRAAAHEGAPVARKIGKGPLAPAPRATKTAGSGSSAGTPRSARRGRAKS